MMGLYATSIAPTPPAAGKTQQMPAGQPHVVKVTFSMQMTNFASTPALTEPSDALPTPTDGTPADPRSNPDATPDAPPDDALTPRQTPPPNAPPRPDPLAQRLAQALQDAPPKPANTPSQPVDADPQTLARLDDPPPIQPRLAVNESKTDPIDTLIPDISAQLQDIAPTNDPPQPAIPSQEKQDNPKPPATKPTTNPTAEQAQDQAEPTPPSDADRPAEQDPDPAPQQTADTSDADRDDAEINPAAQVYDQDSVDTLIAFDKMQRPTPPAVSKRLGESGTVRILIQVDETGSLIDFTVIEKTPHRRLLAAAIAALKRSTFHPAQREGNPVHSTRVIEYRF